MKFFIVFSLILFILYLYTGWRFINPNSYSNLSNISLWFLLLLMYLLPITTFFLRINRIEGQYSDYFTWVSYISLGVFSILFFIFLGIDFFSFISKFLPLKNNFDPDRKAFLGLSIKTILSGFGGVISIYGIFNGLRIPEIITQKIKFSNLPDDLKNFKIAHITDLHVGSQIKAEMINQVVDKINSFKPDIVVFTGDAADGSVENYGKEMDPLKNIKSKYGKYFVTGNHEYYSDLKGWLNKIQNIGFKILINESKQLKINNSTLLITGIPDRTAKYYLKSHKTNMEKAIKGYENSNFKLLLAHQPKDIDHAEKFGYDLQLSGHTHGGQYIPFSFLVRLANPFLKGLHQKNKTKIYINQGTGFWGPSIRIGTVPEITKIILS